MILAFSRCSHLASSLVLPLSRHLKKSFVSGVLRGVQHSKGSLRATQYKHAQHEAQLRGRRLDYMGA